MESQPEQQPIFNSGRQVGLPNATAILVLGIVSIPTSCCFGIVGLACGIIAMILAKRDKAVFLAMPDNYTSGSYENVKAGKICAIIGISLSSLATIYYILYFMVIGTLISNPTLFKNFGK